MGGATGTRTAVGCANTGPPGAILGGTMVVLAGPVAVAMATEAAAN